MQEDAYRLDICHFDRQTCRTVDVSEGSMYFANSPRLGVRMSVGVKTVLSPVTGPHWENIGDFGILNLEECQED